MIENIDGRIKVGEKFLPSGDIQILKILLNNGTLSVHKISELKGEIYDQYTSSRLRFLTSATLHNIVLKVERGKYEINPEVKEELEEALNNL